LGLWWTSPHLVILITPTAVKLNGITQWQHLFRNGLLKSSREQHFTVVLLANAHLNAYISCSPILKFPPLYHTTCLLLLIKNLTSCTSRDINLSKTTQKNYSKGCHKSLRILPHTMPPASRRQLRRPMLHPQFLILTPYPHHKQKMGEW
jgi:hypothetical protein